METQNITFRIERPLVEFLRRRAEMNDRTLNGEIRSILRNLETEKASVPASNPDASEQ